MKSKLSLTKKVQLGDNVEILTGPAFPSSKFSNEPTGTKLVRGDNVTTGSLRWGSKARFWNDVTPDLEKYLLNEGDILIGMDGSRVGKNRCQLKNKDLPLLLVQRVACLRSKNDLLQDYLWLMIDNEKFSNYVNSIRTGSAIPHISVKQIKEYEIILPSKKSQEKISLIINSIYHKIEFLKAQNFILDKISQSIFKSWFIDFDEHNVFVDSELGKIPKGWNCTILDNYLQRITYGFTCPMPTSDIGPYMITAKDLKDNKINFTEARRTTQEAFENNLTDKSRPQKNDVLLSKDASLGRLAIVNDATICINQSVALLRPNSNITSYFLYYLLLSPNYQQQMLSEADGSVIQHLYITRVNQMLVVMPPIKIQNQFEKICKNIFKQIDFNMKNISSLTKIRKSLLPKLISGEIQI